jgi:hypothetical protein
LLFVIPHSLLLSSKKITTLLEFNSFPHNSYFPSVSFSILHLLVYFVFLFLFFPPPHPKVRKKKYLRRSSCSFSHYFASSSSCLFVLFVYSFFLFVLFVVSSSLFCLLKKFKFGTCHFLPLLLLYFSSLSCPLALYFVFLTMKSSLGLLSFFLLFTFSSSSSSYSFSPSVTCSSDTFSCISLLASFLKLNYQVPRLCLNYKDASCARGVSSSCFENSGWCPLHFSLLFKCSLPVYCS